MNDGTILGILLPTYATLDMLLSGRGGAAVGKMVGVTPSFRATASMCRPRGGPGPSAELCSVLGHSPRVLHPTTWDKLGRAVSTDF